MEKESKIYVAGHLGMVGSAIVRRLTREGYTNLVLRTRRELDLLDQQAVQRFFEQERPEYVFLAAAKVGGILANNTYRAQFIYENLQIQNNVIHSAYRSGVKKLLFLGSSCIYPKLAPQPMKEEHLLTGPLEPTNEPYAVAKIAGIKMCQAYWDQYGCRFISAMPTNLYGPNDNFDLQTSHVLPALMRKMHLGKCLETGNWEALRADLDQRPIEGVDGRADENTILTKLRAYGIGYEGGSGTVVVTLWGTGEPRREFLHVDDLADACLFLMQHYEDRQFINVGVGEDLPIKALAFLIREIVGYRGELRFDTGKPDGTPRKLLDVSRMRNLGWKAAVPLQEGIRRTYEWFLEAVSRRPMKG